MRPQFSETEIPAFVDKLLSLICYREKPLATEHFLSPFICEYDQWRPTSDFAQIPTKVLQLASMSAGIFQFRKDWQQPETKKYLINRIRNHDQVRGLLFEFRAATYYIHNHKKVSWMANCGSRAFPDLRVTTYSGAIVYTECTRKQEKLRRSENEDTLKQDILGTLADKMNQRQEMCHPLHLVIYIPEVFNWAANSDFNKSLGKGIHGRFNGGHKERYSVVTAVTVISSDLPRIGINSQGFRYHDTSLPSITYHNPCAKYKLPEDFSCTI